MKLKERLYLMKMEALYKTGVKKGLIIPFNDELYSELNKTIVNNIPVDIEIKYLRPDVGPGKCWDRSLYMFFSLEGSVLVRGSLEYFRFFGDESYENHGWVERDGLVYDPTWRCIYDKDYYYKIFNVQNVSRYTKDDYCNANELNREIYEKVKNTTRQKLKEDNDLRFSLSISVPLLREIARLNSDFKVELEKYLEEIDYDEEQIIKAMNEKIEKELQKNKICK